MVIVSPVAVGRQIILGTGALIAATKLTSFYFQYVHKSKLRLLVAQRRQERNESIKQVENQLYKTPKHIRETIQQMPYLELRDQLRSGTVTCVQVLHAYQEMAIKAHEQTNCITEFVSEAQEMAEMCDKQRSEGQHVNLPLFGLPFSVKESIVMKGYLSTLGFASFISRGVSHKNSTAVDILCKAGAIPFVRTNVSQALTYGCSNAVYGTTTNPHNSLKSPGGSSSGEGALLACGGSVFGLGTDLAGSIRIPAHFCGISGLRPTSKRLCQNGANPMVQSKPLTNSTIGPMSQSTQCVHDVSKVLIGSEQNLNDPLVVPILWQTIQHRPLVIGYYDSVDAVLPATHVCRRAVRETVEKLRCLGHKVVPWKIPRMAEANSWALTASTGGETEMITKLVMNDLICDDQMQILTTLSIDKRLRPFYLRSSSLCPRSIKYLDQLPKAVGECHQIYTQIQIWQAQVLKEWQASGIDVLICPPHPMPALSIHDVQKYWHSFIYTSAFNMLDAPTGVVKVTQVTDQDVLDDSRLFQNDCSEQDTIGLPIGVQVAALPYHDELCVHVMQLIADLI